MTTILEKIEENRKTKITVCNDPVNGLPEDFAEDYDRLFYIMISEARKAGHSEEEIMEVADRGTASGRKELAGVFEARRRRKKKNA
ncbi:unnamed protein product [marine sediment metagenome]|uniref:Uncharacterized protein n=1 Tax=marine sediment metagenome TaxID=412755 RepID=X0YR61_9ZZZZ